MEEKEIHLRDYFNVIIKRRHVVAVVFLVVFLAFVIAAFSAVPIYIASTKVLIEKNEPGNIANMTYYMPYDPEFYETQYQLIRGTSVAQRVVKMLSLDKAPEGGKGGSGGLNIVSGTIDWFRRLFSLASSLSGSSRPDQTKQTVTTETEKESRITALAKSISSSISVVPVKNSKIVNISYVSTNPELAAMITNSVVKAYTDELLEMKMNASKYAMMWLTQKADEERSKLSSSEKTLQEYMRDKDIVTLENKIAMVPERLTEVSTKIAMSETKRKEMESLYNKVKGITQNIEEAESIPAIASDPSIQSIRAQIFKAEQNIGELSKKFGQKHPVMTAAVADLKILREKRDNEIRRVIESIKNEYDLARSNEENFRKMASQTKAETLRLNEKYVQYEALKRETEANKQLFDAIIKKIKEQDITQDIQTVNVWVVEKADTPGSPAKPNRTFIILMGLLCGIGGGIGLAFFIEYLDNTIKTPDDAEAKTGIAVLGVVPLLREKETHMEEVVMKDPHSIFAETYKALRTSVLLSSAARPPRNILITSTSAGEGKTVTSVNLAMTIAQSEKSVLLVDADLRRPRIHKIFGLDNVKGLSTYLAGADASEDEIIVSGFAPKFSVISSGPIPPNPSELLSSSRMLDLIKALSERFDIIIWDSPPLLSVTDSLILSKILDGTIVVTRGGTTTYENARRAIKNLTDIESHVLGIVINALDTKKSGYAYNRYYDYHYGSE